MTRLLCEPGDRIGSNTAQVSVLTTRSGINSTLRGSGFVGFGKDGAEEIMRHAWFNGIDWESGLKSYPMCIGGVADEQIFTRRKLHISPIWWATMTPGTLTKISQMRWVE